MCIALRWIDDKHCELLISNLLRYLYINYSPDQHAVLTRGEECDSVGAPGALWRLEVLYGQCTLLYHIIDSTNCVKKHALVSLFFVPRMTPHPKFCSLFIVGTIYRVIWQGWQTYAYQKSVELLCMFTSFFRFCVLGIKSHIKRKHAFCV